MQIAPGLHRIGDDVIAAYLLVDDTGITLIDAGLPGLRRALRRELGALGRGEDDIRGVILTHADADHLGFAEALRCERAIPVHVGAGEEAYARREVGAKPNEKSAWRWGPALRFVIAGVRWGGRTRALRETVTVHDGDVLDLPGSPRILAVPGHTAGHIVIHAPHHDAVLIGDAATTRHVLTGAEGPGEAPFSEDPAEARRSLDALRSLDVRFVLPGHGSVWSGGTTAFLDSVRGRRPR